MAPIVDGLEQLYGDVVNFVVVDIDVPANEPVMAVLGYSPRVRPGLYILAPDGTVEALWIGVVDGHTIHQTLVDIIAKYEK